MCFKGGLIVSIELLDRFLIKPSREQLDILESTDGLQLSILTESVEFVGAFFKLADMLEDVKLLPFFIPLPLLLSLHSDDTLRFNIQLISLSSTFYYYKGVRLD